MINDPGRINLRKAPRAAIVSTALYAIFVLGFDDDIVALFAAFAVVRCAGVLRLRWRGSTLGPPRTPGCSSSAQGRRRWNTVSRAHLAATPMAMVLDTRAGRPLLRR